MSSKKFFFLLIFLISFFTGLGQLRSNKDLIGKWTASSLKLEFLPDGRILFVMRGGSLPGARYKTDFMQMPALLEIELVQQTKKIVYRTTIEFINDRSIRLTSYDKDPAKTFGKERNVVLIKEK